MKFPGRTAVPPARVHLFHKDNMGTLLAALLESRGTGMPRPRVLSKRDM